jgi:hypothetical protein
MPRAFSVLCLLLLVACAPWEASAVEKKKDFISLYEVPTTGKIVDVEYRPEFDEWWVKCKEGDSIVIYSYDKRGHKWGKIVFSAKKSEEPGSAPERTKPAPPPETAPVSPRPEESAKPPEKRGDKPAWWDPLNIIKSGEKLIGPQPSGAPK